MLAEVVVDLLDLGDLVGEASGRGISVLPKLTSVTDLWEGLGLEVDTIHLIAPDFATRSEGDASFSELHAKAWWETEKVFVANESFSVQFHHSPPAAGRIARDALMVTTALSRSDELTQSNEDHLVVVMSNRPEVGPAVSYARGVPVMIAGTVVTDPGLAHIRLEQAWFADLGSRSAAIELDVELRAGRPWRDNVAIATPYGGTEGRLNRDWSLSQFSKSIAIFDPETFTIGKTSADSEAAAPSPTAIAATIQRLGLGELVHVEVADDSDPMLDTSLVATLYRFAADYPTLSLTVVSSRPSLIIATSDLAAHSLPNPSRFVRLCVPERDAIFDEAVYANEIGACRVVLESSQTDSLFEQDDQATQTLDGSPVLTLLSNPNTAREDSAKWREQTQRRFVLLGADAAEAVPADSADGPALPVSLGGCSDFLFRGPRLRPGVIVEALRSNDGERWIIVSDPIERRRRRRSDENGASVTNQNNDLATTATAVTQAA